MPIYRGTLIYLILFLFAVWGFGARISDLIPLVSCLLILSVCLFMMIESLLGCLRIKGCVRFITRNGFEIHVSDEAERDPELYLKLVASKVLKSLELNQPAYIVAHSNREKELLASIPGVVSEDASFMVRLSHFVSISVYNKEAGGKQRFRFIKRYKDVKRRWNYGCVYYKVPVDIKAIEHLKNLGLDVSIGPSGFMYLLTIVMIIISIVLLMILVLF